MFSMLIFKFERCKGTKLIASQDLPTAIILENPFTVIFIIDMNRISCNFGLWLSHMSILHIKQVEGPAELGLWNITEGTESLLKVLKLSEVEAELYGSFRTDWRKKQWLAYRRLIKEIISPKKYPVHYDESGKPFLAGSDWHISVSHTGDYAGVIISRDVRVGIDLEMVQPRIDRVKEKFLDESELSAISTHKWLEHLTLSWCAKEAIYKLYGWRNLDFKKNIRIRLPGKAEENIFYGDILLPSGVQSYKLFVEMNGNLMVVWAIEGHMEKR
jgi:phosphopantetheinyl transferase (holo-ACP synthase)